MREAYKSAGVDVEAGYRAVELIKGHAARTARTEVFSGIGGFGGLFSARALKNMADPVLVSGTDGVGTKIQLAYLLNRHTTVGVDCVAMCVNDIICAGAEPLFFLDYIACGKNEPERTANIVRGVADGCAQSGAALIGGETAEHPGLMPLDEYDLAGFAVGVVERAKIIDGSRVQPGDTLIGLASDGAHTNGFSLIRKIFNIGRDAASAERLNVRIDALGATLGEALLTPTRIYVKPILALINKMDVLGLSHITGGGLIENIPRMLPGGAKAVIRKGAWPIPPIFGLIAETGGLKPDDLYGTFNMGLGMALAVRKADAGAATALLRELGETAYEIGEVTAGEGIEIC